MDEGPECSHSAVRRLCLENEVNARSNNGCNNENCDEEIPGLQEQDQYLARQVFSIPLVFREILQYLDIPSLLKCSLVNKYWNYYARQVLRENKNCLAIIEEENSCRDLIQLNQLLSNSENIPFNGLSISVPWSNRNHECISYDDSVDEFTAAILSKIDVKYLSIDCERASDCISLECIRHILWNRAEALEGLCLDQLPYMTLTLTEFLGLEFEGTAWLPRMKILEFPYELLEDNTPESVIKELVDASPNLKSLHGNINTECLEFLVPEKRSHVIREFHYRPTIKSLKIVSEFVAAQPRLKKLRFSTAEPDDENMLMFSEWPSSNYEQVVRVCSLLLTSSVNTVEKFAVDHLDLILMTTKWNLTTLPHLQHLSLMFSSGIDVHQDGSQSLRKIDFAKYFPNLKEVCVTNSVFEDLDHDFYIHEEFKRSKILHSCPTVTKFCLAKYLRSMDVHQIQMFKQLFPNVKHFYLGKSHQLVAILKELWSAWTDLESIIVSPVVVTKAFTKIWDSIFLGIHELEVEDLEAINNYQDLEMVPRAPSITNLTKLKKFAVHFTHPDSECTNQKHFTRFVFLTPLTGYCAFRRIPGLTVEIGRDLCDAKESCCLYFNHLNPFVKFVEESAETEISY